MRVLQERRPVASPLIYRPLSIPLAAAVVVVGDQLSKNWALHHLASGPRHVVGPVNLVLTLNSGAAFSLGARITPFVEVAVVALVLWLLVLSRRASRRASVATLIGFGMVLGGALSNLGDRLFRHLHGSVVDFVQGVSWWPVFNVADASVVVGVAILLLTQAHRSSAPAR